MAAAIFLSNQGYEIAVLPFTLNLSSYSSSSLMLESVHFVHVIGGLLALYLLKLEKGEAGFEGFWSGRSYFDVTFTFSNFENDYQVSI